MPYPDLMQNFADLSTKISARDCRRISGKILLVKLKSGVQVPTDKATRLFAQNVTALVKHYQDAGEGRTKQRTAKEMRISTRSLYNACSGSHSPTLDTVQAVADFFELDVWQLFMEDLPTDLLLQPRLAKLVRNVVKLAVQDRIEESRKQARTM